MCCQAASGSTTSTFLLHFNMFESSRELETFKQCFPFFSPSLLSLPSSGIIQSKNQGIRCHTSKVGLGSTVAHGRGLGDHEVVAPGGRQVAPGRMTKGRKQPLGHRQDALSLSFNEMSVWPAHPSTHQHTRTHRHVHMCMHAQTHTKHACTYLHTQSRCTAADLPGVSQGEDLDQKMLLEFKTVVVGTAAQSQRCRS